MCVRLRVCLKAQCLASILVGWLQLASGAFVCYLAVKYVTLKIKIYLKKFQRFNFYLLILNILCSLVLVYRKLTI